MQRIFLPAAALALLLPLVAHAGTGELLRDLQGVRAELQHAAEEDAERSGDLAIETADELFPATGASQSSSAGRIDDRLQDRAGQFLIITVDGREVILRDVPKAEWFAPYVRYVADHQLVSGYRDTAGQPTGLFGPGDNVTVEQLSKILVLAAGIDLQTCPAAAKNLSASGSWSIPYISCAEQAGWSLYADGNVPVGRLASRAEVLVTMMQSFGVPYAEPAGPIFEDVGAAIQFAGFVARAKADGVVSGYADAEGIPTGRFGPDDPVTRAETAKIISLGIQMYR